MMRAPLAAMILAPISAIFPSCRTTDTPFISAPITGYTSTLRMTMVSADRRCRNRVECRGISLSRPPAGRTLRSALLLFLVVFLVDQILLFGLFGRARVDL